MSALLEIHRWWLSAALSSFGSIGGVLVQRELTRRPTVALIQLRGGAMMAVASGGQGEDVMLPMMVNPGESGVVAVVEVPAGGRDVLNRMSCYVAC